MATGGSINIDVLSDETFDLLCSVCKIKGIYLEAEKYCVECNDYYCLACVRAHQDVVLLSKHKMLDKGSFKTNKMLSDSQQGSSQTVPAAPTERCNIHNHNYIDMYCQNHDDVGCATCILEDHGSCRDTFYIPEFLQNNASNTPSKDTVQILEGVARMLTDRHSNLKHKKQKLIRKNAEALEKIRTFRKEINKKLDKLEQNSIDEIESLIKAFIEEIDKAIKVVQAKQSCIVSAQSKLASPEQNMSQVFVNSKKGNKTAKMITDFMEENETQVPLEDIDYKSDQRLVYFLKEINSLGTFIQRNVKDEGDIDSFSGNPEDQQIISSQSALQKKYAFATTQHRNVLLQGHRKKKVDVKVESDKSVCSIVSACELEDGTILLSDFSNMKLKRLDSSSYTVTDYCNLRDKPWQVCAISEKEAAVSLPFQEVVQFVSVESGMTKTRKLKTYHHCFGLAYANGDLYISDSNTSIYIYRVTGMRLRYFSLEQLGQKPTSILQKMAVNPLMHSSTHIYSLAVSKDGFTIYVADYYKGLIVVDKNGETVGQFNGPQLKVARGCFLTDVGNLLLCGEYSRNVLQFGPSGEFIGEVMKSDKNRGYKAVCCHQQKSELIVGSHSNEIDVYDLK